MASDSPKRKLPLTWEQINQAVDNILFQMRKDNYLPLTILGIGSGGIIPASLLAYKLAKATGTHPNVEAIYAWSYNEAEAKPVRTPVQIEWPPQEHITQYLNYPSTLLMDDIVDSGNTLAAFLERIPQLNTAVLVHKKISSVKPNYYGVVDQCHDDFWYDFPWETV